MMKLATLLDVKNTIYGLVRTWGFNPSKVFIYPDPFNPPTEANFCLLVENDPGFSKHLVYSKDILTRQNYLEFELTKILQCKVAVQSKFNIKDNITSVSKIIESLDKSPETILSKFTDYNQIKNLEDEDHKFLNNITTLNNILCYKQGIAIARYKLQNPDSNIDKLDQYSRHIIGYILSNPVLASAVSKNPNLLDETKAVFQQKPSDTKKNVPIFTSNV